MRNRWFAFNYVHSTSRYCFYLHILVIGHWSLRLAILARYANFDSEILKKPGLWIEIQYRFEFGSRPKSNIDSNSNFLKNRFECFKNIGNGHGLRHKDKRIYSEKKDRSTREIYYLITCYIIINNISFFKASVTVNLWFSALFKKMSTFPVLAF